MKRIFTLYSLLLFCVFGYSQTNVINSGTDSIIFQNSGTKTVVISPDGKMRLGSIGVFENSALLQLNSSSKGILITRMSTAQRDAISSPASGLLIYNTSNNEFNFYNGSAWTVVGSAGSAGWEITGNSGTTHLNFIGTNDNRSLRFKTNSLGRMIIDSLGNVGIGTQFPQSPLHVAINGSQSGILFQSADNTSSSGGFYAMKSKGTKESPNAVLLNDQLGSFGALGYNGTDFGANGPTGEIVFYAAENFASGSHGTRLMLRTTDVGSDQSSERLFINTNGNVTVGTSTSNFVQDSRLFVAKGNVTYNGINAQLMIADSAYPQRVMMLGYDPNLVSSAGTGFIQTMERPGIFTNLILNPNGGNVGIGHTNPIFKFHIADDANGYAMIQHSNTGSNGGIILGRTRGTVASPSSTISNDILGQLAFASFDGSNWQESAAIDAVATENTSGSGAGSALRLRTTPNGSVTSQSAVLIDQNGKVCIGPSNPIEKLDVVNASGQAFVAIDANANPGYKFRVSGTEKGVFYYNNAQNGMYYYSNTLLDAPLVIKDNGKVGIGGGSAVNPGYTLDVNGNIHSNGITETSDIRWKKDIMTIDNALNKTLQLRGVTYNWKTDEFKDKNFSNKNQIGLIAQEVESVIPQAVNTDANGYKSVEYSKLVALLIEAVKEQQQKIDLLEKENTSLKNKNNNEINLLKAELNILNKRLDQLDGGIKSTVK